MLVSKIEVDELRELLNNAVYYTNSTFKRAYTLDERLPALEAAYKNILSLIMVLSTTPIPERVKCISTFKVAMADMSGVNSELNKDTLLYLDAILVQMQFLDPKFKCVEWGTHIATSLVGVCSPSELKVVVNQGDADSSYESQAIHALLLLAAYGHDLMDYLDISK